MPAWDSLLGIRDRLVRSTLLGVGGLRVAGDAFQEEVSHLRSAGDVKYPFGVLRELAVSVGGKPHEIHRSKDGIENLLLGGLENIFAHASILAV